ncbi:MAG: histidine phosphatase family protein [Planctomycetales bacterium]|nr:histidine phosphatase family protein [Planctomycetales bacterium]
MKLYLIRHGESANNALPEYQRVEDPHLTPTGFAQAAGLGRWAARTPLDVLLVSPFRRTLQTAQPIHEATRLEPRIWVDLHERGGCYAGWQPSNFQGRPGFGPAEIRGIFPGAVLEDAIDESGWWRSQPRETDAQASARAVRIVERFKRTFLGSSVQIACVMHADFKKLVVDHLRGEPEPEFLFSPYRNASITTVEFSPDGSPSILNDNCVAHLAELV